MENVPGIYRIDNETTGDFYIGSSINVRKRWAQHIYTLRRKIHGNTKLLHDWHLYGEDAFAISLLEVCEPTKEHLLAREQHYIDTLKPQYNMCPKAGSRLGSKTSEETKRKMSEIMRGRPGKPCSPETREKLRNREIKPEWRAKISAGGKGRIHSADTRAKMAEAHRGYKPSQYSIDLTMAKKTENRLKRIAEEVAKLPSKPIKKNDVRHMLRRLTDEQVRDIRNSGLMDRLLADKYGCTPGAIAKIRKRVTYKDVW